MILEPEEVRRHFEETGALLTGHFLLSSGLHSDQYVQCARVLTWPSRAAVLGSAIGALFEAEAPDLVVGPAMGGIIIGHEVARYLGVPCIFSERVDGEMRFRRGFTIEPDARVLVVEDVVTTGGSALEVAKEIGATGAVVIGVSSILFRALPEGSGQGANPFGEIPFRPLWSTPIDALSPEECPMCRKGEAFHKPGSRTAPKASSAESNAQ
jgi:orotate phosphoribosyltransferase